MKRAFKILTMAVTIIYQMLYRDKLLAVWSLITCFKLSDFIELVGRLEANRFIGFTFIDNAYYRVLLVYFEF